MPRLSEARKLYRRGSAALSVLLFLGIWLAPSVASAHSFLIRTTPASGTAAAVPDVVSLTFNERPRGRFSVVQVTGPDRARRDVGAVSVLNDTVTQKIAGTRPAGQWTVDWRVVSSDGHPVSGQWRFTAAAAAPALAAPAVGAAQTAAKDNGGAHLGHVAFGFVIAALMLLSYGVERWWKHRSRRAT